MTLNFMSITCKANASLARHGSVGIIIKRAVTDSHVTHGNQLTAHRHRILRLHGLQHGHVAVQIGVHVREGVLRRIPHAGLREDMVMLTSADCLVRSQRDTVHTSGGCWQGHDAAVWRRSTSM